jgi:hypothetical protein
LSQDDPERSVRELDEALAPWSKRAYHLQHFWALYGHVEAALYRGDGGAAWQRVESQWPQVQRSLLLRVQTIRSFARLLHARAALAAVQFTGDFTRLGAAEMDARRVMHERMPWSTAMARLVLAGVAAARVDRDGALQHLDSAVRGLDEAGMGLFAAARRRLGALVGGDIGTALIRGADAWMLAQGISDSGRMTDLAAPGFFRC